MNNPMLQIADLRLVLGGKRLLDGVSLDLDTGERVLVAAGSGTGKSTLLRCILGFLIPQQGTIALQGEPVTAQSIWSLRNLMGYVAQEPVLGNGSVREILARPFAYHSNSMLQDNVKRAPALLEKLRLPQKIMDQQIQALSGGEKQRIALLAALLLDRPLLLLDEVTASLDRDSADAVFRTLAARPGQTILAVGHHRDALPSANRVIVLEPGHVHAEAQA